MRLTKPSFRVLSVSALVAGLAACSATTLTPTWEKWFSANDQESRYEVVHKVIYDVAGAVVSVGSSSQTTGTRDDLVVIKQGTDGSQYWKTVVDISGYDRPWDAVIGTDGSIYVVTESALVKFASTGAEVWRKNISTLIGGDAAIRDLEISGNQLYVAGRDLYTFDLNGNLTNAVAQNAPLWDVVVSGNSVYTAGTGQVRRYTAALAPVWSYSLPAVQNPPAELAVAADGSVYAATYNSNPQDSAYLTKLNSSGAQVWSKYFADPDSSSFQLPGTPKVQLLPNGNVVLGLSQNPTRVLNIIDPATGSVKSSTTQRTGLIDEMGVDSKGRIYVAGAKVPQVFDSTAALLANGTFPADADLTGGGFAVTADSIYVGAGVMKNGTSKLYVSRYANQ